MAHAGYEVVSLNSPDCGDPQKGTPNVGKPPSSVNTKTLNPG